MGEPPVPIAVVGIGCRLPGGADNPEKLWQLLSEGRNAWTDVPPARFKWSSFHHPNHDMQGTYSHRGGHFIDQDIAAFDARFFGIPPNEANAMDPKQRILLEIAYEAFENAGIPLEKVQGSNTGVYIATFTHDYETMMLKDPQFLPNYLLTGIGQAILSNRISYVFDLKGPSITLDTACSGSLVALHQACQSLRSKESDIALAGGTNLILNPDIMIPMSLLRILNDDGKCYSFDSRGSGYGRGEGVALVVLKRFDDALKAGDNIRSVILNTGVGQDGKTAGITMPSGDAQQNLIHSVYRAAHLDPLDTGYIEAHGTGTVVGDVAEIDAINSVFRTSHRRDVPLYVGSIKSNIGHLESSSGIAGLVKVILALEKGYIPANPNLDVEKDRLFLAQRNIKIPRKLEPWPKAEIRRASVNSFGYGGTNAHAILEAVHPIYLASSERDINGRTTSNGPNAPAPTNGYHGDQCGYANQHILYNKTPQNSPGPHSSQDTTERYYRNDAGLGDSQDIPHDHHRSKCQQHCLCQICKPDTAFPKTDRLGPSNGSVTILSTELTREEQKQISETTLNSRLFPVTAKSEKSLLKALDDLRQWASSHDGYDTCIRDLSFTLATRRSILSWRHTFVAATRQDLLSSLNIKPRTSRASSHCLVTFVFTGQGAQWYAMGRELIATSTVFRKSLLDSGRILQELGTSWSLLDELLLDEASSRVGESEIGQPATTAIQIALVDLYASLAVSPDIVVGHSSGEIGAAYAASALSKDSALKVSYHRSFLAKRCKKLLKARGAMLAVGLGEKDVLQYISCLQTGRVAIACANSLTSTTISGDEGAIVELEGILGESSVLATRLKVDTAYHSHHMEIVADSYLSALEDLQFDQPRTSVKFFSSVTGEEKTTGFGPSYWVRNLVSKVRFYDALSSICGHLTQNPYSVKGIGTVLFVEIGPHHALAGPIRQIVTTICPESMQSLYIPSLIRYRNALQTVLESTGKLFERGYAVNLGSANALSDLRQQPKLITDLSPYPWDHSTTYWHESRLSKDYRLRLHPYHDLLGLRVVGTPPHEPVWRHIVTTESLPWLQEHIVDSYPVFPASGFIAMAIEARIQVTGERQIHGVIRRYVIKDVSFAKALVIPEASQSIELQLSLKGTKSTKDWTASFWESFRVSSFSSDGTWLVHCQGLIMAEMTPPADDFVTSREREQSFAAMAQEQRLHLTRSEQYRKIEPHRLYEDLRSKGNFYGPNFATISEFKLSNRDATGRVKIPNIATSMPSGFIQPHLIHPATLDALIHTCLPVFAQHSTAGSIFTIGIGELSISATIINTPGESLNFATGVTYRGSSSATVDISAFQNNIETGNELVLQIVHGELQGVSDVKNDPDELYLSQGITYRVNWQEDISFRSRSSNKSTIPIANGELLPDDKFHLLNQLATYYINCCLDQTEEDCVQDKQKEYFSWMKRYQSSERFKSIMAEMDGMNIEHCIQQMQYAGVEGQGIQRLGPNLASIVTGESDPLALMLEGDLLYRAYSNDAFNACYQHMNDYIQSLVFKEPNMVVLEIGAGTGGATRPLLEGFSQGEKLLLKRYDFTDVSAGFFERARVLLQRWESLIHYQALDIGRDPVEQGFTAGTYDLVIASNSLHVTNSISNAVANARKLLKPGGRLFLIESTKDPPFVNMLYGVLPGWYCGSNDGRKDSPILSLEQWSTALLHGSFGGVDFAANDHDGPAQIVTFIVSRAITMKTKTPSNTPITILSAPDSTAQHFTFSRHLIDSFSSRDWLVSTAELPLNTLTENIVYVILDDMYHPLLSSPSSARFRGITRILSARSKVLWITLAHEPLSKGNHEYGIVTGLARSARLENNDLRLVTFNIHQDIASDFPDIIRRISDVMHTSFMASETDGPEELEYSYCNGSLLIPRLMPDDKINSIIKRVTSTPDPEKGLFHQKNYPLKLYVETPGLVDSIHFVEDTLAQKPLGTHEIEIKVMACGVNFKDVIVALGRMDASIPMVGECAGVVVGVGSGFQDKYKIGDRVCGWCGTPYASNARFHGYNTYLLPDYMSFSLGASIPVVFVTAYYGLIELANLKKGQTVLIHAAAGGVGQAALRLAQYVGAEIFATVGSASKRQFLMETFGIPEDHIFSSRLGTFKQGVLRLTGGLGVDVVLNSLSGELLHDSWACVSPFGWFVEIGKADIYLKSSISMEQFDKGITFTSVDLAAVSKLRPETNVKRIGAIMSMLEAGNLVPVQPIVTMEMSNISDAFRLLQSGKQIGKVVLEAHESTTVNMIPALPAPTELRSDATYIIVGGLGGLGLEIGLFMAAKGAKHIALLTRRGPGSVERQLLQEKFRLAGASVSILVCDITQKSQCEDMYTRYFCSLPPVRGVIQAAVVLQDGLIDDMELKDFEVAIQPKVHGTRHIQEIFESPSLEFFIMLSSATSIIGGRGSANYAAGNAFQDAMANRHPEGGAHYISLNLGPMKGSGIVARNPKLEKMFAREGFILLKNDQLFALLEYAMNKQAKKDDCKQIVLGFNWDSLSKAENTYLLGLPFLKHLRHQVKDNQGANAGLSSQLIIENISNATSPLEATCIIARSIGQKISTLVVMDSQDVDENAPLESFGLDSLIVIELKNWIARNFQASLQTAEVSDAASIMALAAIVVSKSTIVIKDMIHGDTSGVQSQEARLVTRESADGNDELIGPPKLPKQPLPELHESLEYFLTAMSSVSSSESLDKTRINIHEFEKSNGHGRRLHDRLVKRANDPHNDNWLSDMYMSNFFMKRRTSLVPFSSFFGGHPAGNTIRGPAERAAAISLAAFQCKRMIEVGEIGPSYISERALHTDFYKWLFNACREPRKGEDILQKYHHGDYLVALRHGRPFKVMLREGSRNVSFTRLKATFEAILEVAQGNVSWLSILTADGRDDWAEYREGLRLVSPANEACLHAIEAAAFIICLDDARPQTRAERAYQFFYGNGSNRWYDKSLQFVICDNGASATVCEHSLLDGTSTAPLKEFIEQAISESAPGNQLNADEENFVSHVQLEELLFETTPLIDERTQRLRQMFEARRSKYYYAGFDLTEVNGLFFRANKCSPKSGVQLVIQLACYRFFGYNPAASETVSMAHFRNGRVALSQTVWPQVVSFCKAADDPSLSVSDRRTLFSEAALSLAKSLNRAVKGYSTSRYMMALEWMLDATEPRPALFDDPVYKQATTEMVTTDCLENDLLECGLVLRNAGSIWIHYQTLDQRVHFSIWGNEVDASEFQRQVEVAAKDISLLFV
ncbi:polyketide synthase [Xylographa opegraphella]|nr:polyketide synthase [Xylographa opegraphella]